MTDNTSAVEKASDYGEGDAGTVSRWLAEIELAEKDHDEWLKRCKKIVDRYRDKRNATDTDTRKLNIFWSNIQTLLPAIYARTPKPDIQRRFKDADPVGRNAAEVLERACDFQVSSGSFDESLRACVLDYTLVARGQAWVRYVPHFQPAVQVAPEDSAGAAESDEPEQEDATETPADEGDEPTAPAQEVVFEEVAVDHVHSSDFMHNPARTWAEVRWVSRKSYMTRDAMVARKFKDADNVELDYTPDGVPNETDAEPKWQAFKKATVYEIWDKPSRKVYWIAKGQKSAPLDERDDPLRLKNFFPCPRPALGTVDNSTLIPTPDYIEYQDQAAELDDLTARIATLSKALKVVGIYDASFDQLKRLLEEGVDNTMIPVENWGATAEKGGLKGVCDFLPIQQVCETLMELYKAREQVKDNLYEITGLSDIIRGESDPRETAEAQGIKARFGTMRLQDRQAEVQRFARDLVRIMAEIIAEHFSMDTLRIMTGVQLPTRAQVQAAMMAQQRAAQAQAMQQQPGMGPGGGPMAVAGAEGRAPNSANAANPPPPAPIPSQPGAA